MSDRSFSAASYALVRVVHLTRPPSAAPPFWLPGVRELVIEVYATTPPSQLYVYGADPGATPPPLKSIVFSVALPDARLAALLECVDGTRAFTAVAVASNVALAHAALREPRKSD
jgi:hypothetical protein